MIYFDNASTTFIDTRVLKTYETLLSKYFANPSGAHSLSREVNRLQDKARLEILKSFNYERGKVIFTSSATEANNLALKGLFLNYKNRGNEIIISAFEHPSIIETAKVLEEECGAKVILIPVNNKGQFDLEYFKKALSSKTILVSLMAVNNEIGSINMFHEIKDILKDYPKVILHSDVTQAVGKIILDYNVFDAFSFSAHKLHGLKGSGALIMKEKLNVTPLLYGGAQEEGVRAGTSNAPTNILLAQTVRLALKAQNDNYKRAKLLSECLITLLSEYPTYFVINSLNDNPFIVNFSLLNTKASVVLNGLENKEIYVGTTSSCSAKLHEPSRSVLAAFHDENRAHNALRISFSAHNTITEVNTFFTVLLRLVKGENHE